MEKNKTAEQDWDEYWSDKEASPGAVYDFLAGIYRRLVIKNILNHFVRKYFPKGAKVLHSGCGSGQVDVDIAGHVDITALDVSANALRQYRATRGEACRTVQGDILALPFPDSTFDGVYNLGVLEHFTQEQIQRILTESYRVLKPGGRTIILWPPTFGFTVFILDSAHFIMRRIFGLQVKLHPDEITRVRSRRHAAETFEAAGFSLIEYYFGPRDIFTQVVVVAEKKG